MSVLKRRSSIALIIGIIILLLLIPIWYTMLVPSIIASEIEKIDSITTYKGTLGKEGYLFCITEYGVWELPIQVEAHAYVEDVKGDNVILKIEVNITRTDTNETLPELSSNSTYVFNKFTRENVWPSDADKNRTGYDPLYPSHLKAGEDIPKAWLDTLNKTATLEFKASVKEEGVTLYKYFVNETIPNKNMSLPVTGLGNYTLTYARTIFIEPLSGSPAYTENETLSIIKNYTSPYPPYQQILTPLVYLTYKSTAEAKAQGIADAKATYEGMQLLELYIPSIVGVIAIILIVGLAFNVRRLKRKKLPELKTRSPSKLVYTLDNQNL